jgi:hypothetical protein
VEICDDGSGIDQCLMPHGFSEFVLSCRQFVIADTDRGDKTDELLAMANTGSLCQEARIDLLVDIQATQTE